MSVRYLQPEGNGMKYWLSGCVSSCSVQSASHVLDLLFSSTYDAEVRDACKFFVPVGN